MVIINFDKIIVHTSHNDFCLSPIPMLWHRRNRSFVERGPRTADLAEPKP